MENTINWELIKNFDGVIAKLALNDRETRYNKRTKQYSLSINTEYIIDTKKNYLNGIINEEEAKAILLRQKLCGNAF